MVVVFSREKKIYKETNEPKMKRESVWMDSVCLRLADLFGWDACLVYVFVYFVFFSSMVFSLLLIQNDQIIIINKL